MDGIGDFATLRAHFGTVHPLAETKVLPKLDVHARAFIGLSPFLVLATAEQYRVQEWASAWREELRILQTAPLEEFQRLPAPAAILFTGPSDYRGVPIFDSQWDLTAAVASRTPLKENRRPYQALHTIYTAGEFTWTWDGATLSKSREGRLEAAFPAPQLYLWREGASSHLEIAQPGFRWPHESPDFD